MKSFPLILLSLFPQTACSKDNGNNSGDHQLTLVFQDSTYQLTGVAKDGKGDLIVNYPRWSSVDQ